MGRVRGLVVLVALVVALVVALAVPTAALAQDAAPRRPAFGLRAGATIDPDQFHLGFHVDVGEIVPRLRFQPSAEIGFGSSRTTLVGNVDVLYRIHTTRTISISAGGGVGFGIQWPEEADSTGLVGANLIGTLEWGTRPTPHVAGATGSQVRYFLDLRGGLGDLPAFKVTAGILF